MRPCFSGRKCLMVHLCDATRRTGSAAACKTHSSPKGFYLTNWSSSRCIYLMRITCDGLHRGPSKSPQEKRTRATNTRSQGILHHTTTQTHSPPLPPLPSPHRPRPSLLPNPCHPAPPESSKSYSPNSVSVSTDWSESSPNSPDGHVGPGRAPCSASTWAMSGLRD